jgi:group I intron endonuclease
MCYHINMEKMLYVIYKITCLDKTYVGSTCHGFLYRRAKHLNELRRNKHGNKKLQHCYNKYGESAFMFEILEYVTNRDEVLPCEQKYIDLLKPWFNICAKAGNSSGRLHTEESKKKLREAWKRRPPMSEETKRKISETQKRTRIPHPQSAESREKMRLSHLGKKMSDEQKEKLRKINLGKKMSAESVEKTRIANKGRIRGPMKQEHKDAISKANMGRICSEVTREKIGNANRGKTLTPEHISKVVAAHKGKKLTLEHIEKLKASNKMHTPESRKRASENMKRIWSERRLNKEDTSNEFTDAPSSH